MTSTHSLRFRHHLQPGDNQLLSPADAAAAAGDTPLTDMNSDVGKRQTQLELIKKAKHNRGKVTFAAESLCFNSIASVV